MDSWRSKARFWVIFILSFLLSACDADKYCGSPYGTHYRHCDYGCCGFQNNECCDPPVALIVGLSVGGVVFVVGVIVLVYSCYYRNKQVASRQCHLSQPANIYQTQMGMSFSPSFQSGLSYNPYRQFPGDNLNSPTDLTVPMQSADNSMREEKCDPIPEVSVEPCKDDENQSSSHVPVVHNSMKEESCDPIPQITIQPCLNDDESQSGDYGPAAHNSMKDEESCPFPQITIEPCTDDDDSQSDGHGFVDPNLGTLDKK